MPVQTFRKRPLEVEAVRWTGDNFAEVATFTSSRFALATDEDRAGDPTLTAAVFEQTYEQHDQD